MAEELKELIEKIQMEGVKAAEDKALEIDNRARRKAEEMLNNAAKEAAALVADAKLRIIRLEEGAKASVKQSARDTMLSLRKEITAMLDRIVSAHVHKALSQEELAKMLMSIVKANENKDKIVVSLKKEDVDKFEKAILSELAQEARKGITVKAADIHGGFLISYDKGKSYFDFSEAALAECLASHLKAGLAEIVKGAVSA